MVKVYKILIALIFLILLSSKVYAINVGGVVKNKHIEISDYESEKITMLFWVAEEESYKLKLSVAKSPNNWLVIIDPSEFILNKTTGEEFISLPYLNEQIKAKVVNVFVKPDKDSRPGEYFISVKLEEDYTESNGNIQIIPQRLFEFEVDLTGKFVSFNGNDEEDKNSFYESYLKPDIEKSEMINDNHDSINEEYVNYSIMFLFLLVLIVIYKNIDGVYG